MGMAEPYPPQPDTAPLTLQCLKSDDQTLSCIVCDRDRCEWVVEFRLPGKRVWKGVHERCRERVSVKP